MAGKILIGGRKVSILALKAEKWQCAVYVMFPPQSEKVKLLCTTALSVTKMWSKSRDVQY